MCGDCAIPRWRHRYHQDENAQMQVQLAEKWHRDAGAGTSEMDGDEENGIAMEVQVRMLQDCETCIRTCSARHAVGLRVVARGRQVLARRTVNARRRRRW